MSSDVAPPPPVPAFGSSSIAPIEPRAVVTETRVDELAETPAEDFDLSTLERVEAELREVEPAMKAIEDGTYGECGKCGMKLTEELLDQFPAGMCSDRQQLPGCPSLRLPIDN